MTCWQRNRINGRRLGTARPFPLWRQSSFVDQYSENAPRTSGLRLEPLAVRKATLETTVRRCPSTAHVKESSVSPDRASARTLCGHDPHFSTHEELFSRKDRLGWACNPRP